jgi:HK97 family phage major capsid protein
MLRQPFHAVSKPTLQAWARFRRGSGRRLVHALASEFGALTIKVDRKEDVEALSREHLRTAIDERSEVLHNIFEEAGADLDASKVKIIEVKDGVELAQQVNARNEELNWLGERQQHFDALDAVNRSNEERRRQPAGADPNNWAPTGSRPADQPPRHKSLGEVFVESELYQKAKDHQDARMDGGHVSQFLPRPINAEFLTTAGWAPESLRTGRLVLDEQREIEVTDVLPAIPTTQAAVVYMEETTFTNAAAERAESAAYAESTLALTERSQTVRSVGTSIPVSDEQLADVVGVRAYLDSRLGFMVRQRLDSQILVGNGTAPNLLGTLNVSGINTQALGADTRPDAIYKGIKAARVTGRAEPNVVIIHPNDWEPIRLLKTTDGVYIWGAPSDTGVMRIWGLPVIATTAVTEGTAIAGDYARFSALHVRQGLEVLTGFVNDDFLDGRQTVRAGLRVAVVHYRPSAFTQITGL